MTDLMPDAKWFALILGTGPIGHARGSEYRLVRKTTTGWFGPDGVFRIHRESAPA